MVRGQAAGARFSVISENVAEAPSALMIQDAWMNSPKHRENLLDPRVDSIGIRVIARGDRLYAVEDFGSVGDESFAGATGGCCSAASAVEVFRGDIADD